MANTEYERRASQDYIDREPTRYDASSGWGIIIGVVALVAVLAMLFVGFGSGNRDTTTTQPAPAVERTAPPATQGPVTQPTPTPTNPQ